MDLPALQRNGALGGTAIEPDATPPDLPSGRQSERDRIVKVSEMRLIFIKALVVITVQQPVERIGSTSHGNLCTIRSIAELFSDIFSLLLAQSKFTFVGEKERSFYSISNVLALSSGV